MRNQEWGRVRGGGRERESDEGIEMKVGREGSRKEGRKYVVSVCPSRGRKCCVGKDGNSSDVMCAQCGMVWQIPEVIRTAGPLLALPVAGSSMGLDPARASSALKPDMHRRTISSAD